LKRYFRFIVVASITILSLTGLGTNVANADVVTKRGKISFYNPTKAGYDKKIMIENDCAVDQSYKYLPKGTKISVYNLGNGSSKVLEKWDIGNFAQYDVILDVLPKTFKALGGVENDGYIYKGMVQWNDGGITRVIEDETENNELTE